MIPNKAEAMLIDAMRAAGLDVYRYRDDNGRPWEARIVNGRIVRRRVEEAQS